MSVSEELKSILACPKCRGSLDYPQEIEEIHCLACKLAYPIDEGIPVMLVEEAKPLDER